MISSQLNTTTDYAALLTNAALGRNCSCNSDEDHVRTLASDGFNTCLDWAAPPDWQTFNGPLADAIEHCSEEQHSLDQANRDRGDPTTIFIGTGPWHAAVSMVIEAHQAEASGAHQRHQVLAINDLQPNKLWQRLNQLNPQSCTLVGISGSRKTVETRALMRTMKHWQQHDHGGSRRYWLTDCADKKPTSRFFPLNICAHKNANALFAAPFSLAVYLPLSILKGVAATQTLHHHLRHRADTLRTAAAEVASDLAIQGNQTIGLVLQSNLPAMRDYLRSVARQCLCGKAEYFRPAIIFADSDRLPDRLPDSLSSNVTFRGDPLTRAMEEVYYWTSVFVIWAIRADINFATHPRVQHYKRLLNKTPLTNQPLQPLINLPNWLRHQLFSSPTPRSRPVHLVRYGNPGPKTDQLLNQDGLLRSELVEKHAGSDWNHHSYQLAHSGQILVILLYGNIELPATDSNHLDQAFKQQQQLLTNIAFATALSLPQSSILVDGRP